MNVASLLLLFHLEMSSFIFLACDDAHGGFFLPNTVGITYAIVLKPIKCFKQNMMVADFSCEKQTNLKVLKEDSRNSSCFKEGRGSRSGATTESISGP